MGEASNYLRDIYLESPHWQPSRKLYPSLQNLWTQRQFLSLAITITFLRSRKYCLPRIRKVFASADRQQLVVLLLHILGKVPTRLNKSISSWAVGWSDRFWAALSKHYTNFSPTDIMYKFTTLSGLVCLLHSQSAIFLAGIRIKWRLLLQLTWLNDLKFVSSTKKAHKVGKERAHASCHFLEALHDGGSWKFEKTNILQNKQK